MIRRLLKLLYWIANRDKIPPLPRGYLATEYHVLPRQEARVVARLGARDPIGVGIRLKRAGVNSVDELVKQIDHYEAEREVKRRFLSAVGRVLRSTPYDPHARALIQAGRDERRRRKNAHIHDRLQQAIKAMEER